MQRLLIRAGLFVILFVALFAVTAELAVRTMAPRPRAQVLRAAPDLTLAELDGVPVWSTPIDAELRNEACVGTTRIVFAGDSIFHTTGSRTAQAVFTTRLQTLARARGLDWCVHNVSRPAFAGPQKSAAAREALSSLHPDLIVYGLWSEDAVYWRLGDSVYEVSEHHRDADGYPVIPGLGGPLHHLLFRTSRAWEYAVLALGVLDSLRPGDPEARRREPIARLLEAAGTTPVLVVQLPRLDQPLGVSADHPEPNRHRVLAWAGEHGARTLVLAELLRDRDHRELRLDPCCHYNDQGHALLAERLLPTIADALP